MKNHLELAYETEALQVGIKKYITWDYAKHPHLLILGYTGSGKSYFIRTLLGRVGLRVTNSKIWVCDYKNDFQFLEQNANSRYFGYKKVIDGFNEFYSILERELESGVGEKRRDFRLLLIDEYVGWLNSMDKKESEDIKKKMANLLFMSRAFRMQVLLGCQRGMAEDFSKGSRDCLNKIFLGAPSKESIRSFCSSDEAELIKPCEQGAGYVLFDGCLPKAITVPSITDQKRLETCIIRAATR